MGILNAFGIRERMVWYPQLETDLSRPRSNATHQSRLSNIPSHTLNDNYDKIRRSECTGIIHSRTVKVILHGHHALTRAQHVGSPLPFDQVRAKKSSMSVPPGGPIRRDNTVLVRVIWWRHGSHPD
jgi:hypothetical protein